jgi:aspartate racemase
MEKSQDKKTIGIIGGMGPEATADIFTKIINLTPAEQDSDHIHILIDNNPQIPSRVQAILHNGESPIPELIRMAKSLEKSGADFLIIPCNTASYYINDIRKHVSIPVVSIVEETSKYIFKNFNQHNIIGLLGTEMTVRLGLYQKELVKNGINLICKDHHCNIVEQLQTSVEEYKRFIGLDVDKHYKVKFSNHLSKNNRISILAPYLKSMRDLVMKAIYGKEGIKAGKKELPKKLLIKAVKELEQEGARIVILGCTEIPLALTEKHIGKVLLVDPTEVLAKSAIEIALGKNVFGINY